MMRPWGPFSPLGLTVAALTLAADQAHKAWMLYVYDIGAKGVVTITPTILKTCATEPATLEDKWATRVGSNNTSP